MKIKSTHNVVVTTEELARALGFSGAVKAFKFDAGDVHLTIEGDIATPSTSAPTPTPAPAPMPAEQAIAAAGALDEMPRGWSYGGGA
jgi:hypothetical protein